MKRYTDEKQAQVVLALLKAHGIRYVVASPGTTNMAFVCSAQNDPHFTVFSSVDERSSAYMACGLAAESGEPVVISCTGATASRNYLPGLTEAYYRKLPVLSLTATQPQARAGHLVAQVIDRSAMPADVVNLSVQLPVVKDAEDLWDCEMKVNQALLELKRRGGGPVHINLPTSYSRNFDQAELPKFRVIERWSEDDALPELKGRVAVFVGARRTWTAEETAALEAFCEANDAAVFCDHTSGYYGKYRLQTALLGGQENRDKSKLRPDVLIHVGEVSGDYFTHPLVGREVWRVSPDGEIRDAFRKLRHVFEMSELRFFRAYGKGAGRGTAYHDACKAEIAALRRLIPEVPFSNIWLGSQLAGRIPVGSRIHFAILNSLRAWNFEDLPAGVTSSSNVGGFGIDGCTSSAIGAALACPDRLVFFVTGDLAFFYDMNVLGNRHLPANLRILLVNNGKGTEFTQHGHPGAAYGPGANAFVAADGHFGRKSPDLVRGYVEALGFEYHAIHSKQDGVAAMSRLVSPEGRERPVLVEAFVDAEDESRALQMMRNLDPDKPAGGAKMVVKELIGQDNINKAKRILGR